MERSAEGTQRMYPQHPYPGDAYPREAYPPGMYPPYQYPSAMEPNPPYEYYPGEATLRPSAVAGRPPWSPAMLVAAMGAIVIGAWAGLVPFVGPKFGFTLGSSAAWKLTDDHIYLQLAPGAAGVLAGLILLGFVPGRDRKLFWRGVAVGAAVLCIAAGAWLVIGPDAYTVIRHVPANGRTLPTRTLASFATQVGYYLGPGVLLAVFGGMALSLGSLRRRRSELR